MGHEETRFPIDARTEEITYLLKAWGGGDEAALVRLTERVYPELRLMARRYMKNEAQENSLQATRTPTSPSLKMLALSTRSYSCLDLLTGVGVHAAAWRDDSAVHDSTSTLK